MKAVFSSITIARSVSLRSTKYPTRQTVLLLVLFVKIVKTLKLAKSNIFVIYQYLLVEQMDNKISISLKRNNKQNAHTLFFQ